MTKRTANLIPESIIELNVTSGNKDIGNAWHVYLTNIPQNQHATISFISDIIFGNWSGISIYTPELSFDIIKELHQIWDGHDHVEGVDGIAIQHIIGVGYVISTTGTFTDFIVNEYTPEDYVKKMEEYIVVSIAKQEKHYIKDWVAYHLRIGFDRIYLFDNNNIDGERYDEILKEYIDADKLELIDARGENGVQNSVYNAMYFSLPFKWMGVFDIDEFIWFKENGRYSNIKQFVESICYDPKRFGILLQWHCYAPSGDDKPSDKPIWEANTKLLPYNTRKDCRCEYIHEWCKSIYKPGYRIMLNEHFSWEPGGICKEVDCNDKPIIKAQLIYIDEKDFLDQEVYVKHFMMRNIHDFYHNKYMRGHAGADFGKGLDGWLYFQWRQNMNYFTDSVGTLTEKEQIYLAKKGMKMNYTFHPDVFINWYIAEGHDHINTGVRAKILNDVMLPMTNAFLTMIYMCNGFNIKQPQIDGMFNRENTYDYDLNFLAYELYSNYYMDVLMDDERKKNRKYIQEPVVINIGLPAKFVAQEVSPEEQKFYMDFLLKIFNEYNLREFIRAALEHNTTVIPTLGVEDENDYAGKGDELKDFLQGLGLELPKNVLNNNTLIMPWNQYQKFKKYHSEFTRKFGFNGAYNDDICRHILNGESDNYQLYTHSIMSVIEHPYFVWPA